MKAPAPISYYGLSSLKNIGTEWYETGIKRYNCFSFLAFFFNFCIGFVYYDHFVLYFEVISFTMINYIALINSFW